MAHDVLLVEDNPADVELTRVALENAALPLTLHHAADGVEAMEFLRREGPHADAPRPAIVLLDLNLPRRDGRAVLQQIKSDPDLRMIPVVVLTSSEAERDIQHSYELGANCYIRKPVGFDRFQQILAAIEQFWFVVVHLPKDRAT